MLLLMTAPLALARAWAGIAHRPFDPRGAAAIGLALLFLFTGIGHFARTEPMSLMLPAWVPERVFLIYLTGVLELAIAGAFLVKGSRGWAGWAAAAVLVLFFPANIYAAIHHVPFGGHAMGPAYLLVRAPLQLAILAWVYWFTIRRPRPGA